MANEEKNSGPLHNWSVRSDPISRKYLLAAALASKKITACPR